MAASTESAQVYLSVILDHRVEALRSAVQRFIRGEVPDHNGRFVPSTAELSRVVRDIDLKMHENELFKLYGPSSYVDFGPGRIEERGLSKEQMDMLYRLGGKLPDGPNGTPGTYLGRLTIEQRQRVLNKKTIAALENGTPLHKVLNLPAPESDKTVPMPKLRSM